MASGSAPAKEARPRKERMLMARRRFMPAMKHANAWERSRFFCLDVPLGSIRGAIRCRDPSEQLLPPDPVQLVKPENTLFDQIIRTARPSRDPDGQRWRRQPSG